MKNDIFVIKRQHKFPKGISPSTQEAIKEHWLKTRGVDLSEPQYEIYSAKEQEKERKQKLDLDKITIKVKNDDDYFTNCDKLRAQGYTHTYPGLSSGNWKHILKREKELKSMGYNTKVSYYKNFYTLWRK